MSCERKSHALPFGWLLVASCIMSVEEYYHMALYMHMEVQHASKHCIWQCGCSMTNCSASDKHVVAVYESAQKAKLCEHHWNPSSWQLNMNIETKLLQLS